MEETTSEHVNISAIHIMTNNQESTTISNNFDEMPSIENKEKR